jgi:RNA 2',3'-cyclic 3'-phosphodiesterase
VGASRLFVALPVPERVRTSLASAVAPCRDRLDGLSWTRPEGWHVTLAFLGSVDDHLVDEVVATVAAAAAAAAVTAPMLALGAAGRFGGRALWVRVDDDPQGTVAALGEGVQAALDDAGLPVQRRPVRPHVTLARGRRDRPVARRDVDAVAAVLDPDPVHRWHADGVEVVRSLLGRGPARYVTLAAVPFGDVGG